MILHKNGLRIFLFFLITLLAAGCAGTHKYGTQREREKLGEAEIRTMEGHTLRINKFNGEEVDTYVVKTIPGTHFLKVNFSSENKKVDETLNYILSKHWSKEEHIIVNAQAGKAYYIQFEIDNQEKIRFWVDSHDFHSRLSKNSKPLIWKKGEGFRQAERIFNLPASEIFKGLKNELLLQEQKRNFISRVWISLMFNTQQLEQDQYRIRAFMPDLFIGMEGVGYFDIVPIDEGKTKVILTIDNLRLTRAKYRKFLEYTFKDIVL